uniref:EI24 domain-containing protein n=1 Tax=Paenirhodobacter enshiensis TaxID=1105367 RepID=UPI0035B398DC
MNLTLALRAWQDLLLPGAFRIVLKGVAFAIVALTVMAFTLAWAIGLVVPADVSLPWIGETDALHALAGWAAFGLVVFASVFLMVPVASIFTGFFLEDVAELVEGAHYPTLPKVAPQPLLDSLVKTLKFFGVVIAANLLALLIYPFVIPFAPLLFLALNGYLLGREYFQMAAERRMPEAQARALYLRNRPAIWTMGVLMALPLSVPLVNLVVPVVGAAAFTHLFHRLARR